MKYIVVSYNNQTKEVVNRTINERCKSDVLYRFGVDNYWSKEVLLNIIEIGDD